MPTSCCYSMYTSSMLLAPASLAIKDQQQQHTAVAVVVASWDIEHQSPIYGLSSTQQKAAAAG